MPIVIRIVSADGRRVFSKALPGLPTRLKVPAGARVEVIEDGHTKTLAVYMNEHAHRDERTNGDSASVIVEPAESWEEAEASLSSVAATPYSSTSGEWYSSAEDGGGGALGLGGGGLLIGGLVAAGGAAALALGGGGGSGSSKDTTVPDPPTALDLAADDDTGVSATDNITTKKTGLTITGTAEANATVELFNGTTSLGTVTANAQGAFSKDIDLAEGQHDITAKATDAGGNVSGASAALRIVVDATAPAAPAALDLDAADDNGASNTDNITTQTSGLTITGTAEAGATVELFDGTTSLGTALAGAGGTFSKDISLATGSHQITAKATDPAGNAGPLSTALTITVVTPPIAPNTLALGPGDDTGISATDNITNKTQGLTITGAAEAGSTVRLFAGEADLGSVLVGSTGNFSLDVVNFGQGTFSLTAQATDVNGNVGPRSAPLVITIDTTPPPAPTGLDLAAADDDGTSSTDNITSKTDGLTISGSAEAGSTVELFRGTASLGSAVANGEGQFTLDISLAVGVHQITAKATDVAGNVGQPSAALLLTIVSAPAATALAAESHAAALHADLYPADLLGGGADSSTTFG